MCIHGTQAATYREWVGFGFWFCYAIVHGVYGVWTEGEGGSYGVLDAVRKFHFELWVCEHNFYWTRDRCSIEVVVFMYIRDEGLKGLLKKMSCLFCF